MRVRVSPWAPINKRAGRVVEGTSLLRKHTGLNLYRGFESLALRHINTCMLKYALLFLIAIITGCATKPLPMPAPACDMTVAGKCRGMTAGESGGAAVRGHSKDIQDSK